MWIINLCLTAKKFKFTSHNTVYPLRASPLPFRKFCLLRRQNFGYTRSVIHNNTKLLYFLDNIAKIVIIDLVVESGVDLGVLLQYKNSKSTEIYTHVSNKDLRKIKSPLDLILKQGLNDDKNWVSTKEVYIRWCRLYAQIGRIFDSVGYKRVICHYCNIIDKEPSMVLLRS